MLPNTGLSQRNIPLARSISRIAVWLFAFLLLLISLGALFATPTAPVAADADFVEEFRGIGNYGFAASGVGTRGDAANNTWTGSGTFTITIPATATVLKARLIWTGRSDAFDANGVELARNGTALGTITSDTATGYRYFQDPWCCNGQQRHESEDVTSFVLPGENVFTVSGHEHGTSPLDDNLNYGAGLWVVYEDANEPVGEVVVYQGQDSFFRKWTSPRGPHTEVRCATFTPSTEDRVVDVTHLVSGIDTYDNGDNPGGDNWGRDRSVIFWYETGLGATPPITETLNATTGEPTLSSRQPDAFGLIETDPGPPDNTPFAMQSRSGLEWDNYHVMGGLDVPANNEWACFQIESGDFNNISGEMTNPTDPDADPLAASGMWNLFAIRVRPDVPTAVTLSALNARHQGGLDVNVNWSTEAEVDNFGFKLYRASSNQFAAAEEIHFEPSALPNGNGMGADYQFADTVSAYGQWWYWLEDVDTSGETTLHGPAPVFVARVHTVYVPIVLR